MEWLIYSLRAMLGLHGTRCFALQSQQEDDGGGRCGVALNV